MCKRVEVAHGPGQAALCWAGWTPNRPGMQCALRSGSSQSAEGAQAGALGRPLNRMRDDRASARAVVVVRCAVLRAVHAALRWLGSS